MPIIIQDLPFQSADVGIRAPDGLYVAPGSRIVGYVRSTGRQAYDPPHIANNLTTSVKNLLTQCRAGFEDVIVVLPGHTETVGTTLLTGAVQGTRIAGVGVSPDKDNAPTFTWDAATANMACSVKNMTFENLRFVANADNITKAITTTAAGLKFLNCVVLCGVAANKDMAIVFSVEGGSNALQIDNCCIYGTLGVSQAINISGACDNVRITNSCIRTVTAAVGTGTVAITSTSTNYVTGLRIENCVIENQLASSTAALTFTDIAHTGWVRNNSIGTMANSATPAAGGIVPAGSTNILVHYINNYHSDGLKGTSGILAPVVTS